MAQIHEQLYSTANLRDVDLAKQVTALSDNLFSSYGIDSARIARYLSIEPIALGIDQAVPVGLILNELISNALKHAFPAGREGSIWIEAARTDDALVISVRDNGVGVPENVECHRPKSLGLEIVRTLTRQLSGTLSLQRGVQTTFQLSIPENTRRAKAHQA